MTMESREAFPESGAWTREQLKLAFCLYCETPFGKLHARNQEIINLAPLIGRTPSALAMKLVNFASLDPTITNSGRKGLGNASHLDREVWDDFHSDWERLTVECDALRQQLMTSRPTMIKEGPIESDEGLSMDDFTGETRDAIAKQRMKQRFFRRTVLGSYQGRCCMSGVSEPRLLIASHIVPWNKDKANRLNPTNGLCLSAIHDRAFDSGLITLSTSFRVMVSAQLREGDGEFIGTVFLPLENRLIELPERFAPNPEFLAYHREHVFVGG